MDQTANNIGAQILEIKNLRTYFYTDYGIVKAVDGLNLDLKQGEALGIMGESGSGKTVTALSILRLVARPGRIIEGEILFHGEDLLKKSEEAMRDIRAKKISMVFQDPTSSLNPVYTIGNQLEETVKIHSKNKDPRKTTIEMLKMVEIPTPEEKMRSYPHQLSGGMKQRVFIAIAFLRDPEILIADEATTNLDVTIQAQILLLMDNLRKKFGTSLIVITHDLGVIAETCDRVAVMYAGKLMELADVNTIFGNPVHPYTKALLSSIPRIDIRSERMQIIPGDVPELINPPSGCLFHPRCNYAIDECKKIVPSPIEISKEHIVSCLLHGKLRGSKDV